MTAAPAPSLTYAQHATPLVEMQREAAATLITFHRGVPDDGQLRTLSNRAMIRGAIVGAAIATLVAGIAYPLVRESVRPPRSLIYTAFIAAFSAMMIAFFVWQTRFNRQSDTLRRALRQLTRFAIGRSAISINSDGPYGTVNRTIPYAQIRRMSEMTVYPEGDFAPDPLATTGTRLAIELHDRSVVMCLPDRLSPDYHLVAGEALFAAILEQLAALGCAWKFQSERQDIDRVPLSSCRLNCERSGIRFWLAISSGALLIGMHAGWQYWIPDAWLIRDLLADLFSGAYLPMGKTLTSLPRDLIVKYQIERLNVR